ncbi:Superfamily II DNA or RNA helicase, SNF2 family [Geosmithia morbida]|uniref:Superfamily II DNA or RNA helicase, SNF2 family n=1 Tax=Geosmithia morbida TaxID=1094350 RepID=A0A9P4YUB6_9HYPO|nr:Superfamily II DNA or RNA helicase, SNF2 family [Geosmithia morbida]KAF4122697.1 Superfamily II DNA or RNA helicase, SNF2 family [Geosmithia morbida]
MVNERAPPRPAAALQRRSSDDEDDIISAMRNLAALKPIARQGLASQNGDGDDNDTASSSSARQQPNHGRMMSSLKQKANVFNQRSSRPEHHLMNANRVRPPPAPPSYRNRKAPPLPVFSSNSGSSGGGGGGGGGFGGFGGADEVFYTDPNKANEDLKNLLEGNMDDDDDDEEGEGGGGGEEEARKEGGGGGTEHASEDPKSGFIRGLEVRLLPHQVEGVEWMRGRELGPVKRGKVPKGGILADDMGLGKTLQTISLILTNQKPARDARDARDTGDGKGGSRWKKHYEGVDKTTLVVAPLALIRQWEAEMDDKVAKAHRLKVCVHHGPGRTKDGEDLARYDVVVTTYQILVSEFGASSEDVKVGCFGVNWWRVVLDEAHTIKNRNAKATKACCALRSEYRWCLSGTPMQNNLDELQSLIKFLRIRPYDDLREWKQQIDLPLKNGKGHIAIRRLHSVLRCFMKRRTKDILREEGALIPGGKPTASGDKGKGDAAADADADADTDADAGGKTKSMTTSGFKVTQRKVVLVSTELTPAERKFYTRLEARADRSIEAMMGGKVNYAGALTLLLRMRQACDHPKLVAGKLDKDAMSTGLGGGGPKLQDKETVAADVDSMVDMFSGMGLAAVAKSCSICGSKLAGEDVRLARDMCTDCSNDLAYFDGKGSDKDKKKKEKKTKTTTTTKKKKKESRKMPAGTAKPQAQPRRRRNRNAVVVDSDDEDDDEGSWIVPEDQRDGSDLGKAGGQSDEDAEGGGQWLRHEDSDEDSDEEEGDEQSRDLSGFVVDDETNDDDDDDDDSLLSISAITKQMASQTLEDDRSSPKKVPDKKKKSAGRVVDSSDEQGDEDEEDEEDEEEDDESDDADESSDSGSSVGANSKMHASAKIRELLRILRGEAAEHKFIVFSQFTSMLDLVEPFLEDEGLGFTRYDGSMRNDEREESLRSLRKDAQTRILLCSLKCGSLGLNLTAATRVVILEPFWNPFVEEQAIDRVHRLTQTVDVVIYRLTVSNSIEERILALQDKKRELAEQAIEGGMRKGAFKLGINEIIDLFKPGAAHVGGPDPVPVPDPVPHHAVDQTTSRPGGSGGSSNTSRSGSGLVRKNHGIQRQESEVFGRRW